MSKKLQKTIDDGTLLYAGSPEYIIAIKGYHVMFGNGVLFNATATNYYIVDNLRDLKQLIKYLIGDLRKLTVGYQHELNTIFNNADTIAKYYNNDSRIRYTEHYCDSCEELKRLYLCIHNEQFVYMCFKCFFYIKVDTPITLLCKYCNGLPQQDYIVFGKQFSITSNSFNNVSRMVNSKCKYCNDNGIYDLTYQSAEIDYLIPLQGNRENIDSYAVDLLSYLKGLETQDAFNLAQYRLVASYYHEYIPIKPDYIGFYSVDFTVFTNNEKNVNLDIFVIELVEKLNGFGIYGTHATTLSNGGDEYKKINVAWLNDTGVHIATKLFKGMLNSYGLLKEDNVTDYEYLLYFKENVVVDSFHMQTTITNGITKLELHNYANLRLTQTYNSFLLINAVNGSGISSSNIIESILDDYFYFMPIDNMIISFINDAEMLVHGLMFKLTDEVDVIMLNLLFDLIATDFKFNSEDYAIAHTKPSVKLKCFCELCNGSGKHFLNGMVCPKCLNSNEFIVTLDKNNLAV